MSVGHAHLVSIPQIVAYAGGDDGEGVPVKLVQQVNQQHHQEHVECVRFHATDHTIHTIARDLVSVSVYKPSFGPSFSVH